MWIGFIATLIIIIVVTMFTKPKYYASREFKPGIPSTASGLAQSNMAQSNMAKSEDSQHKLSQLQEYQEEQFKEAMCNVMRPSFGSKKYKEMMEKRHNETYTIADFMFPHITGRRFQDVVPLKPSKIR
jgi:hypothetical protein